VQAARKVTRIVPTLNCSDNRLEKRKGKKKKAKEFQNFCANEWQDRVGQAQWGKVNQFCQQL
jgi:hypothetical protein